MAESELEDGAFPYDADMHAFLAAGTHEGQRQSPSTHLMMRLLGLEASIFM